MCNAAENIALDRYRRVVKERALAVRGKWIDEYRLYLQQLHARDALRLVALAIARQGVIEVRETFGINEDNAINAARVGLRAGNLVQRQEKTHTELAGDVHQHLIVHAIGPRDRNGTLAKLGA